MVDAIEFVDVWLHIVVRNHLQVSMLETIYGVLHFGGRDPLYPDLVRCVRLFAHGEYEVLVAEFVFDRWRLHRAVRRQTAVFGETGRFVGSGSRARHRKVWLADAGFEDIGMALGTFDA